MPTAAELRLTKELQEIALDRLNAKGIHTQCALGKLLVLQNNYHGFMI